MANFLKTAIIGIVVTCMASQVAKAHVMPWRDGDARMKGFGTCAKGPCMRRYDFSDGKPHHHHGKRLVAGSNRHTTTCDASRTWPER